MSSSKSLYFLLILLAAFSCTSSEISGVVLSPDGVEISYMAKGHGEPALVFIHGWSNNKSIWDAQVEHFSKKHTVVTLDLPGFGESGNNRENWTMKAFAKDVSAVIQTLELDEVILIGFSSGDVVALETSILQPDIVKGVMLVDGVKDINTRYNSGMLLYLEDIMMDVVNEPSIDKLSYFFRDNKEENYERISEMLDRPKEGWRESLASYLAWYNNESTETLTNLKTPVQAIYTNQEPSNIPAFQNYVPSFKATIIPDIGHVIMWEATDEFNRLLEEGIEEFTGS